MSENDIKRLYEGWSRRRYAQARTDFEALLSESNFVEYWGRLKQEAVSKDEERARGLLDNDDEDTNMEDAVDLKTMASQIDLKELQAVLKVKQVSVSRIVDVRDIYSKLYNLSNLARQAVYDFRLRP